MHQMAVVFQHRYLPGTAFSAVPDVQKTRIFEVQINPSLLPKWKRAEEGETVRDPFKGIQPTFFFQSHIFHPPSLGVYRNL